MTELLFITAIVNWMVAAAAVIAGIYLIKKIKEIEERIEHIEHGTVDLNEFNIEL